MPKTLTPAVGYVRMSSGKQEKSPPQQRAEIKKLAIKHHCEIIRWYSDEGISGDATEKRKGFQAMIRDAEEKGDFAVILCWGCEEKGTGAFSHLAAAVDRCAPCSSAYQSVLQGLRARIMARQIRVEYATVEYPSPRGATRARRFIAMMRTGSGSHCVIHRLQEKTKRRSSTGTAFEDPCRQSVTNQPLIPSLDQQASG